MEILNQKINEVKPNYGSITLELFFHQNNLTKVKVIDKTEIVLFEKEKKKWITILFYMQEKSIQP